MKITPKSVRRPVHHALTAAILTLVASSAHALTSSISGTVANVMIIGQAQGAPGDEDFRVFLTGNPVICNGQTYAYMNVGDANYATVTAGLLAARATQSEVTLVFTQTAAGLCWINYVLW